MLDIDVRAKHLTHLACDMLGKYFGPLRRLSKRFVV